MAKYTLPVNVDSANADSGTDPTVQQHQANHDTVHGAIDLFNASMVMVARQFLGYKDSTDGITLLQLLSTDIPTIETEAVTGTTYTLVLADPGKLKTTTNASAVTVTVPPNSSVAIPVNSVIGFTQSGAGQITFAPGAGVTLRSRGAALKSAGQFAEGLTLRKHATDEWYVGGDLTV